MYGTPKGEFLDFIRSQQIDIEPCRFGSGSLFSAHTHMISAYYNLTYGTKISAHHGTASLEDGGKTIAASMTCIRASLLLFNSHFSRIDFIVKQAMLLEVESD